MPPANSQQHTWNRGNLLCGRWCKSLIKDLVVKKAFPSYFFFCYCIDHFNQAGQITLFIEIELPGQVCSLGQPTDIQPCPKSCSGEMIFSLPRQQFYMTIDTLFESIILFSIPANILQSAASSIKLCLGHLPAVKPCPQSFTGDMIFSNLCSSFI